jgi:hypothetical protein
MKSIGELRNSAERMLGLRRTIKGREVVAEATGGFSVMNNHLCALLRFVQMNVSL